MNLDFETLVPMGRRKLIEYSNLAVCLLISSLAIIRVLLLDGIPFPLPALSLVACGIGNAIYIRRGGSSDTAAKILLLILLSGLALGGFRVHAFFGPVLILAPLIPIFAMLLASARVAWLTLAAVIAILTTLFFLQLSGVIPENPNPVALVAFGRFITLVFLCLLSSWIVWCFAQLSQALLANIERKSNTDHLTGVLNRRGIETALSYELARIKRNGGWLSLIMADADHFKLYNDTNGHQAGDQCLVNVAKVLKSSRRRITDVVGRFGGEEFMIILPDTGNQGACKVAEDIRRAMLKEKIPYGPENPLPVSMTLGVVSARGGDIESSEQLIKLADEALYQGKEQGRNRVVNVLFKARNPEQAGVA